MSSATLHSKNHKASASSKTARITMILDANHAIVASISLVLLSVRRLKKGVLDIKKASAPIVIPLFRWKGLHA